MKKLFATLAISACAIAPVLTISAYNHPNIQNKQQAWKPLQKPLDTSCVFTYNNVVYVGTLGQGLYESTDNGKTFHKNKSLQATPFTVEGIIYGYNKVVYVTTVNGLYESTDNGKTFHKNTSISAGVASMYGLKKTIYATAYDGGLWESFDNGRTFVQNKSIGATAQLGQIYYHNQMLYTSSEKGLYESSNMGKTWTEKAYPPAITTSGLSKAILFANKTIYLGTYDGLYQSTDNGETWKLNKGLPIKDNCVNSLVEANNTLYASTLHDDSTGATTYDLYESHDNGKTWTAVPALEKIETYNLRVYNNVIYVETKYNGLYESYDNGKTFTQNKTINHAYLDYIYADQNAVYVGATRGLYRSTDNGKTFVQRFAS